MKIRIFKHRRLFVMSLVAVACLLMAAILIDRGSKIPDLRTISKKLPVPTGASWYAWKSPNQMLVAYGQTWSQVLDVNTITGISVHNTNLEKQFANKPPSFRVLSPDGQWLFANDVYGRPTLHSVIEVNGPRRFSWPNNGEWFAYWLPSSHVLLGDAPDKKGLALYGYEVDTQRHTKQYLPLEVLGGPLAIKNKETVICASRPARDTDQLNISQVSLKTNTIEFKFGVAVPRDATMLRVALSPQSDKLAIEMVLTPKSSLSAISRIPAFRRMFTLEREWRLMIVDLRTHRGKYVAQLPGTSPGIVSWAPDNQHISYNLNDQLYTCDVSAPD